MRARIPVTVRCELLDAGVARTFSSVREAIKVLVVHPAGEEMGLSSNDYKKLMKHLNKVDPDEEFEFKGMTWWKSRRPSASRDVDAHPVVVQDTRDSSATALNEEFRSISSAVKTINRSFSDPERRLCVNTVYKNLQKRRNGEEYEYKGFRFRKLEDGGLGGASETPNGEGRRSGGRSDIMNVEDTEESDVELEEETSDDERQVGSHWAPARAPPGTQLQLGFPTAAPTSTSTASTSAAPAPAAEQEETRRALDAARLLKLRNVNEVPRDDDMPSVLGLGVSFDKVAFQRRHDGTAVLLVFP